MARAKKQSQVSTASSHLSDQFPTSSTSTPHIEQDIQQTTEDTPIVTLEKVE